MTGQKGSALIIVIGVVNFSWPIFPGPLMGETLIAATAGCDCRFLTERGPNLGCICTREMPLHMHDQRALFGSRGTWSAQPDSDTCYAHITLCLPARRARAHGRYRTFATSRHFGRAQGLCFSCVSSMPGPERYAGTRCERRVTVPIYFHVSASMLRALACHKLETRKMRRGLVPSKKVL